MTKNIKYIYKMTTLAFNFNLVYKCCQEGLIEIENDGSLAINEYIIGGIIWLGHDTGIRLQIK